MQWLFLYSSVCSFYMKPNSVDILEFGRKVNLNLQQHEINGEKSNRHHQEEKEGTGRTGGQQTQGERDSGKRVTSGGILTTRNLYLPLL